MRSESFVNDAMVNDYMVNDYMVHGNPCWCHATKIDRPDFVVTKRLVACTACPTAEPTRFMNDEDTTDFIEVGAERQISEAHDQAWYDNLGRQNHGSCVFDDEVD